MTDRKNGNPKNWKDARFIMAPPLQIPSVSEITYMRQHRRDFAIRQDEGFSMPFTGGIHSVGWDFGMEKDAVGWRPNGNHPKRNKKFSFVELLKHYGP